jgi:ATP-dependent Clp protease ATP-binding subunit ClpC
LDYGARPLRRAIEQRIEDPLSEELLRGTFTGKNTIVVGTVKDDEGKVTRLDFVGELRNDPIPAEPAVAGA